jgi:hypothetical protein
MAVKCSIYFHQIFLIVLLEPDPQLEDGIVRMTTGPGSMMTMTRASVSTTEMVLLHNIMDHDNREREDRCQTIDHGHTIPTERKETHYPLHCTVTALITGLESVAQIS